MGRALGGRKEGGGYSMKLVACLLLDVFFAIDGLRIITKVPCFSMSQGQTLPDQHFPPSV